MTTLYLRGMGTGSWDAAADEKPAYPLLPPATSLAFHTSTMSLILFEQDRLRAVARLSPTEGRLFLLFYLFYPDYTPDDAVFAVFAGGNPEQLYQQATARNHLPLLTGEQRHTVTRGITSVRGKLRLVSLDCQRLHETGYILLSTVQRPTAADRALARDAGQKPSETLSISVHSP